MTKRKRIIIVSVAIICLFAILLALFWFIPMLRWELFGVPIEIDHFLPCPDSMVGYYGGQEAFFSEEQKSVVYNAFSQMMEKLKTTAPTDVWFQSSQLEDSICLDFHYNQVYSHTNSAIPLSKVPFDTVSFLLHEDGAVSVIAFVEKDIVRRNGALFSFENGGVSFRNTVKLILGENLPHPMGSPRDVVQGAVINTQKFLDMPDNMIFAQNGQSLTLLQEQKNRIYAALLQMEDVRGGYIQGPTAVVKSKYTLKNLYEDIASNPSLEFRYDRRYMFSGTVIQYNPFPTKEQLEKEVSYVDKTLEYDSVIIVLMQNGVRIAIGCGGLYESIGGETNGLYGLGDGYPAFREEVLSLMQ